MPSRLLDAQRNVPCAPRWLTDRVVAAAPRTGAGAPMPRLYLPKCLAQTIHGRLEEEAHRVRDAKDTAEHPSAGVTHSPPRKAPRTRRGAGGPWSYSTHQVTSPTPAYVRPI